MSKASIIKWIKKWSAKGFKPNPNAEGIKGKGLIKEDIKKEFDSEEEAQKWIDDNSIDGAIIKKEGDKYIVIKKSKDRQSGHREEE